MCFQVGFFSIIFNKNSHIMVEHSRSDKDDNKVKKESDLKKFLKKRSFLYLMCAVVFVVFFVPVYLVQKFLTLYLYAEVFFR